MIAFLIGLGWKALVGIAAVLGALFALWRGQANAKASGVSQQQSAELRQQETNREKADKATASVDAVPDNDIVTELHRAYDRKPVPLGKGDNRQP